MNLQAYEVSVIGTEWTRTVHALSRGKAKYEYWLDVREPWPDIKFTQIRCRTLGSPRNTDAFSNTAAKRGVPFARIGMRVQVGPDFGLLVDRNDSMNFQVLFTSGKYEGQVVNCHPNWMMKYFADDGTLIKEFGGAA